MKCPGRVWLVFAFLVTVSAMPTKEPTTRRYKADGIDTHTNLPFTTYSIDSITTNVNLRTSYSDMPPTHQVSPSLDLIRFVSNSTKDDVNLSSQSDVIVTRDGSRSLKTLGEEVVKDFIDTFLPELDLLNETSQNLNATTRIAVEKPPRPGKRKPQIIVITTKRPKKQQTRNSTKPVTKKPLKIHLETKTRSPPVIKGVQDLYIYTRHGESTSVAPKKKPKPTIHKIITKWSDKPPYGSVKQDFFDAGDVQINPVITSYTPEFTPPSPNTPSPDVVESSSPNSPISQIGISLIPSVQSEKDPGTGIVSNCPTMQISSNVFGFPNQQRQQGCSDLSIAINTHIHQNAERLPTSAVESASTADDNAILLDSDPAALDAIEADDPAPAIPLDVSDDTVAQPAAAADAASPASSGTSSGGGGSPGGGGSSGGGSQGGQQQGPQLPNFDLKQVWPVLKFIKNVLYEVVKKLAKIKYKLIYTISFFATLGTLLSYIPWWIAGLYYKKHQIEKEHNKVEVIYHKHVHKPVYHPDGWFWNQKTKTWMNVDDFVSHHKTGNIDKSFQTVQNKTTSLDNFTSKSTAGIKSWKRRKK